jgi:hypothetical protein
LLVACDDNDRNQRQHNSTQPAEVHRPTLGQEREDSTDEGDGADGDTQGDLEGLVV